MVLTSCHQNTAKPEEKSKEPVLPEITGEGRTQAYKAGDLSLSVDFDNLNIFVENAKNGDQWSTNPENADEDSVAVEDYKSYMKSQFELTYIYDRNVRTINSYTECAMNHQYRVYQIENGIRIEYTLGNASLTVEDLPQKLSKDRANKLILNNPELTEDEKNDFTDSYEIADGTDYYAWKPNNFGSKQKNAIKLFERIGYSAQDLTMDSEMFGISVTASEKIQFVVPVDYTLVDGVFRTSVLLDKMKYPKEYPVLKINLCPYFGAVTNQKDGYIFMPDGSGVLLCFNEKDQKSLSLNVYSNDSSIGKPMETLPSQPVLMPVFGMKSGDSAFLGVIENGDAVSMITATRAGANSTYNTVNPSFTVRARDSMDLSSISSVPADVVVLGKSMLKGRLTVAYLFLNGTQATYAGMARRYREYLLTGKGYQASGKNVTDDIPLYIESIGAVESKKSFLGFHYKSPTVLSSIEETQQMADTMNEAGISNLYVKYSGWFNNGIGQTIANRVKPVGALGSASEMKRFLQKENVYPDVSFLNLVNSRGMSLPTQSARKLDQQYVKTYISATQNGYLVSVSRLDQLADQFLKGMKKYQDFHLSVSDLGNAVCADYNKKREVNRQEAAELVAKAVETLSLKSRGLMANASNVRTALYISHSLNAPLSGNCYLTADKEIPFYEMVFHGLINYAGNPMNLSASYDDDLLKAAAYGSGLYYKFTWKDISALDGIYENEMYSVCFQNWYERCIRDYKNLESVLKGLNSLQITDHYFVSDSCTVTVYENNIKIAVNFGKTDVKVGDVLVKARSSVRIGGQG